MLTSPNNASNQYIRPDYLSSIPATLDAKNSPLALLAQTCSAIGTDAPNPKLIANMEKSGKNLQKSDSRDKSSPGSQSSSLSNSSSESHPKSSFKPYEPSFRDRSVTTPEDYRLTQSITNNHRIKTPKQMHLTHSLQSNGRCESNHSAASPRSSPATSSSRKSSLQQQQQQQPINLEKSASPSASAVTNHRASVTSKESSSAASRSAQESPLYSASKLAEATKESSVLYPKTSTSLTSASTAPTSVPQFFSAYGPGLPYPMDLMAASALMSPHHAMLKAASMNPYLNYANRMKMSGANGTETLGCRDPFCTGCSLNPHPIGKCPTGCTQCEPSAATTAAAAASKSSYAHQMSQAFAHAQLAALAAASQMPYICNWIAGDAAYCGKRFSTSDDLLQHLRTHTASMPESMLRSHTESMLNPATAGLPPTHPLLQRTYPTPPLSPLSGSRYHPYSKPSVLSPSLHPSLAGLPLPHPSLAPYFSPYSLYGRLGTSPGMHP
ncbi:zinc finger protein Elbow isoform X2 [Sitodiplosis mosellana]|uniref:zinc finger protein Elbow isoform X2 n=1 Tax=Sitodiplosis mosellana TaxID=263140 RepID=UPI0024451870|nr:zinc finger protein Elbow isoform X2 [Sitodiplosis mosellana]